MNNQFSKPNEKAGTAWDKVFLSYLEIATRKAELNELC